MTLYLNPHSSQYQAGASTTTRRAGCTWTSLANGIDATTGGRLHPTPDQVHVLVPNDEETSPATPGWSLTDAILAAHRLGIVLEDHSGEGFDAALGYLAAGHAILLQGDSDQFDGTSCSGAFDGDHCIHVHPRSKLEGGERWQWVNDPICSTGRWERVAVLRRYAEKLRATVYFAVFALRVPDVQPAQPPAKPVVLRFGGRKLAKPVAKTIRVPKGRKANVRTAPRTSARAVAHLPNGATFTVYQVAHGQTLAGSARWYGNRTGTRWLHASAF